MVLPPSRAQEPCPVPGPAPKQGCASPLWERSQVADPRAGPSESTEIWTGGRQILSRKFRTSLSGSAAQKHNQEPAKIAREETILLVTRTGGWSSVTLQWMHTQGMPRDWCAPGRGDAAASPTSPFPLALLAWERTALNSADDDEDSLGSPDRKPL